jgi:phage shock protein PspC (stress-responsive transcriptional regulator)
MTVPTYPQADVRDGSLTGARAWFARKGLSRPHDGRLLTGVCASFARRYDVNLLVARLCGVAGILVLTPLVYVAAWVLMPKDATAAPAAASAP